MSLSSISTPSDLAVVICSIQVSLIEGLGETVKVHCLCLDPMSINSVFVILSVSLFAIGQLLTSITPPLRRDQEKTFLLVRLDIVSAETSVGKASIISIHLKGNLVNH